MVMKGQYIQSSYNNRKYFTLGGCLVLKGQYIQSSYNNRKYFTLGGCCGHERPIHMIEATITENISLWEGVWSSKANTYDQANNNRKYFTLGGCCGPEKPIHTIKLQ